MGQSSGTFDSLSSIINIKNCVNVYFEEIKFSIIELNQFHFIQFKNITQIKMDKFEISNLNIQYS